jgi:hypothetical protein
MTLHSEVFQPAKIDARGRTKVWPRNLNSPYMIVNAKILPIPQTLSSGSNPARSRAFFSTARSRTSVWFCGRLDHLVVVVSARARSSLSYTSAERSAGGSGLRLHPFSCGGHTFDLCEVAPERRTKL